jgi:ribosomal protein S18 acetylase RimI-like enzyme
MVPETDAEAVNRLYSLHRMVRRADRFLRRANARRFQAADLFRRRGRGDGAVIGTVTGVDHSAAFDDPERGSSLWTLAVDPQTPHARVGEALIRWLAEHYQTRGCAYMDLSVMHDNKGAIALYEKLGFRRLPGVRGQAPQRHQRAAVRRVRPGRLR